MFTCCYYPLLAGRYPLVPALTRAAPFLYCFLSTSSSTLACYYMDVSQSLDHYENRRDLLRGYLSEYNLLSKEAPDVAALFSLEAFVHFSFAYFRISEQTGGVERLTAALERMRNALPLP